MRTLLFGAGGQLGRDLAATFAELGEVRACAEDEADITDEAAIYRVAEESPPELIVNAAAYTRVDDAEENLTAAFLVNEAGARMVAELAAYLKAPVLHFSTDYVFDGAKGAPYTPEDPIRPLGVYGKSKAAGEAAVRKANPQHFIIRTAWLYGPGGDNFVEKILRAAAQRDRLSVVDDEFGSPTHTLDLARAARDLARTRAYGTHHAVNAGQCSRHEYAVEILRLAGREIPVDPCPSGTYPVKAPRPLYSVMDSSKLESVIGRPMRPWRDALADYIQRREVTV